MRSTALALSALSATSLFVGSHAQASADCQALTAKFIVQVTARTPQPPLLAAVRRCLPTRTRGSPRRLAVRVLLARARAVMRPGESVHCTSVYPCSSGVQ